MEVNNFDEFGEKIGETIDRTDGKKNPKQAKSKKKRFAVYVCVLLVLVFAVGAVLYVQYKPAAEKTDNKAKTADIADDADMVYGGEESFKNCKLLYENCKKEDGCVLDPYCGKGENRVCNIYDCGNSYGIKVQSRGIAPTSFMADKNDNSAAQKNCRWNMEVPEHDCVDNKMVMKIKVSTLGGARLADLTSLMMARKASRTLLLRSMTLRIRSYSISAAM